MTKPSNIPGIETATNITWDGWTAMLDAAGARELPHPEIARLVHKKLEGKVESAGWWSQGVTVAYEQHIGRRLPGQRSDGTFEVAVSKAVRGSMDEAMAIPAWGRKFFKGPL